jgi:dTDP-L-rhamnose 4-epimerase
VKVLVTGGAGFIGSHTADLLLKKGYEVRILDNLEPPVHPRKQKPSYISDDVEFMIGDVRNKSDLEKALNGVSAIFHLAAHQGYMPDFSTFAFVNDGGTALIYEIIVANHLPVEKVIVASSQAVYGEGQYKCSKHGIQHPSPRNLDQLKKGDWEVKCPACGQSAQFVPTDELRVNPHNQYSVSKYSQELYSLTLGRRFGVPSVALRYSITQGPRQSFYNAYSGILRIFTLRLLNGLAPVMYEDGNQIRDYVYVGDVVAANLLALESSAANYEVYNVGGNQILTVSEYAALLLNVAGKCTAPVIPGEFRYGDVRHIVSDITKLKSLGWAPKITIKQIVTEYMEWAEKQPGAKDYYAEAEKAMKDAGAIRFAGGL